MLMKAVTNFRYSHWEHISKYTTSKRNLIIKRITPFFLLSLFLTFWFVHELVAGTAIVTKLILYPFLLVNIVFADFAMWNYLGSRKLWLIWVLECFISAVLIYTIL